MLSISLADHDQVSGNLRIQELVLHSAPWLFDFVSSNVEHRRLQPHVVAVNQQCIFQNASQSWYRNREDTMRVSCINRYGEEFDLPIYCGLQGNNLALLALEQNP